MSAVARVSACPAVITSPATGAQQEANAKTWVGMPSAAAVVVGLMEVDSGICIDKRRYTRQAIPIDRHRYDLRS